jgi:peptidoglycan/LPS O-acetylase OafA/YrhL
MNVQKVSILNPKTKLPGVDVLRGIAALGVAWFHSRVDLWVGFKAIHSDPGAFSRFDWLSSFFSLPVSQMGGMVMLFFVLSGFCIHLPVAKKRLSPNWSAYAVRRFFRIYPAYLATLLFCLIAALLIRKSGHFPDMNLYVASSLMLQNWTYGGAQVEINPSLWSIPVEVEFYLIYPLLLLLWRKFGTFSALLFTLVCTAVGASLFLMGLKLADVSFFSYALIWNSGAWLADRYALGKLPRWSGWHTFAISASATLTLMAGFLKVNDFYLHYGWGLFSFLLLLWVLGPGSDFFRLENAWVKPLVFTGTVSYSLYLVHFPIFKLLGIAWLNLFGSKPDSFLIPTIATFLMLPFAWLFYRSIELPTHRLAQRWGSLIQERT